MVLKDAANLGLAACPCSFLPQVDTGVRVTWQAHTFSICTAVLVGVSPFKRLWEALGESGGRSSKTSRDVIFLPSTAQKDWSVLLILSKGFSPPSYFR